MAEAKASATGASVLLDPHTNKGMGFTAEERDFAGITGLIPYAVQQIELQGNRVMSQIRALEDTLQRYVYLANLQDQNETLFYHVLCTYTAELMPIVYTPTVGKACQEYSHIFRRPRGMFISIKHKGRVAELLANWPRDDVRAIVFTDGERILGLGDQGANGMGIPVGKLSLYTACAGVAPHHCLPVLLDVGTDNAQARGDPLYIGLPQPRVRGPEYDAFVLEFMAAAKARWGETLLLQFEDFGNSNAFRLLEETRRDYCTFNDDIQGTASVALAGVLAAQRIPGALRLRDSVFLFMGAGEAGCGIAQALAYAISCEEAGEGEGEGGCTLEEARRRIWLVDSQGLVTADRKGSGGGGRPLAHHKLPFAHPAPEGGVGDGGLADIVRALRATALIGVCAQPGVFTPDVCAAMAGNTPRPLIFALSNPTTKAECTAAQAYEWTEGQAIFASGSPFDPVQFAGRTLVPGQGNNSYIFPGVALGVLAAGATAISDHMFHVAAHALAALVTDEQLQSGCLYPPLADIRRVSAVIAAAVAANAYDTGVATALPRPDDLLAVCTEMQYTPVYA